MTVPAEVLARAERDEAEKRRRLTVPKELELEFDLGHLLATDRNCTAALKRRAGPGLEPGLRALARDNTQLLVNRLWRLPATRVEEAVVVRLPEPATRLPREKPPPKARPPTRWQQFARLKGIRARKRPGLVWDEARREWRRRWGYRRAGDPTEDWLIEVPDHADPLQDQFAERARAKKERVARNELNRLRNIARAHNVPLPGPGGLRPTGHQDRDELGRAERVAKRSTASVGRFQERLPKEKAPRASGRRRRFRPLLGDLAAERKAQMDVLRLLGSKKPRLDVARAANKQMREEDREEAAAKRRKMGPRGKRKGGRPGTGPGTGKRRGAPPGGKKKKGGKRRK
ncbi:ribosome biogenesis regulatory protein homolog [Tachyglossus aculeatus]|uniref:ribosome biogenesis regulatory protein homolog n=1 Tax=Tachyglossus aculeatus TaxID=9261 RepID=UPI0018F4F491|nr:ribosome biogenesis regulatory protein homolog [Tachyglossus aculeatus]